MSLFKNLFGRSQDKFDRDTFVPLLNGIVRPLQTTAVEQIALARRHISENNAQELFMLLLMHVCLASILDRLDSRKGSSRRESDAFMVFALSQWHQPRGMSPDSARKIFEYTRQMIMGKLAFSDEDALANVGVTLLSIALPNQENFTTGAAIACGQAAQVCWRQAASETDQVLGTQRQIDAGTAKIDQQVYLMNYKDHYAEILGVHLTRPRLAELFLFRGWTAQFGYRVFSSDHYASEMLIGETVNSSKYLGLGVFAKAHGFSIESELGSDFLDLIEDRWREYDLVISTMPKADRIPTTEIMAVCTRRLGITDSTVVHKLSNDFLSQLDFIKRTALEIGLLRA